MDTIINISHENHGARFPGGFSILMAVYGFDDAVLFDAALRSIAANTLQPEEVILVIDGPIPAPIEEVVNHWEAQLKMRVIRLSHNVGLARALNTGLAEVSNQWVVRADADDVNLPNRFAEQAKIASMGIADVIGSAILEVERDGTPIMRRIPPCTHESLQRFARRRNPLNHMTVAMRTALAREAGGYPDILLREDYGLWATLLARGARFRNIEKVLVKVTGGRDMIRRRGGWRYARAEIVLQRHLMNCGLKGKALSVVDGVLRASIFLIPDSWRAWIYRTLLRR